MRRILCLHMPHLATQRARRDAAPQVDPRRPLVLTSRNGTTVVVEQVCPDAFELGLYPGMTLGQAQAHVPQLAVLEYQPRSDMALLRRLARWALRFSPTVEPVEPDTLLLDISGCQRLFGGEGNIVQQAADGLRRTSLMVRVALADTIGAAYAVATTGADETAIVPPGQGSAYLAPLPPGALRIAPEVAAQLESLGVRNIGDLLMLPWSTLPARFGQSLVRRLQQALGEIDERVVPYRPSPVPATREAFEVAVSDWSLVCSTAERLLAELLERLRQRDRILRRLVCTVSYEAIPPAVVSVGLSRATHDMSHLWALFRQRLERVDIAPGVNGLALMAHESERHRDDQLMLFENRAPGDDEALGRLVDSLASRLGHEAIVRPRLVDDHQPEMAYRTVPVVEMGCTPKEKL